MQELVRATFDMNVAPLAVLDDSGRVVFANKAFSELMQVSQQDIDEGNIASVQQALAQTNLQQNELSSLSSECKDFEKIEFKLPNSPKNEIYFMRGRVIRSKGSIPNHILLQFSKRSEG